MKTGCYIAIKYLDVACEGDRLLSILSKFKRELSFAKGNLLVLIISWIFFNFGHSMAFPYESPYIKGLGASPFIIGLIWAAGYLILTIVRIPGAYIADRYGRKQIIVLMTFGVSISYIFYAIAPDWRLVLVGVIFGNLCLIYQPALQAITADSIPPEKRGLGFSLTQVIPSIPAIASPIIAAYLVGTYKLIPGMRIVYMLLVILSLAAAITRWFFLKETLDSSEAIKINELKNVYKDAVSSIIEAWRTVPKSLKILTIVIMISSFEDPVYMQFASLYVFDRVGISEASWGLVISIYIATTLVIGLPAGKLADIIGRKRSIVLAYFLFIPTTIAFILSRNFFQVTIIFMIFAVGSMIIGPAFQALTTDLVPRDKRGRIMGIIGTLNIIAMIFASVLAGALYQLDPSAPFLFIIVTGSTVAFMVATIIKEPTKRED